MSDVSDAPTRAGASRAIGVARDLRRSRPGRFDAAHAILASASLEGDRP